MILLSELSFQNLFCYFAIYVTIRLIFHNFAESFYSSQGNHTNETHQFWALGFCFCRTAATLFGSIAMYKPEKTCPSALISCRANTQFLIEIFMIVFVLSRQDQLNEFDVVFPVVVIQDQIIDIYMEPSFPEFHRDVHINHSLKEFECIFYSKRHPRIFTYSQMTCDPEEFSSPHHYNVLGWIISTMSMAVMYIALPNVCNS